MFLHTCLSLFFLLLQADDRVKSLPGFGPVKEAQYAGYIEVKPEYNGHLFYWFIASQIDPEAKNASTPLIIWINGGPGASSLTGEFTENGPYAINKDGSFQDNSQFAWTAVGHMLFIDQPIGTGYSYTDKGGWAKSEGEVSSMFYTGLTGFLDLHSDLWQNPLYITGESYAGKYIPNIAYEIVNQNEHAREKVNLKSLLLGNGLYDPVNQFKTLPEYYENLGMADENDVAEANQLLVRCEAAAAKDDNNNAFKLCNGASDLLNKAAGDIFLYDIREKDGTAFDGLTKTLGKYLNQADVMDALHTTGHPWVQGDGTSEPNPVGIALQDDFMMNNTLSLFEPLMNAGVQILLYVGNFDGSVCGIAAHTKVVRDFNWSGKSDFWSKPRITWKTRDELVGGYVRQGGHLTFVIIHDSGHLVPTNQPLAALEMVERYILHLGWGN